MPYHLLPPSLYTLSTHQVSSLLLVGCRKLDSNLVHPHNTERHVSPQTGSPRKFPCCKEELYECLSPCHRIVLEWLSFLPDRVVEDVVKGFLKELETHLIEDLDKELILTLINIEKMKTNDLFSTLCCSGISLAISPL